MKYKVLRIFSLVLFLTLFSLEWDSISYASDNNKQEEKQTRKKEKRERKRNKKASEIVNLLETGLKSDSLTISTATGKKKIELLVDSLRKAGVKVDSTSLDSLARRFFADTIRVRGGILPQINAEGSLTNARILDSILYAEKVAMSKEASKKERLNIFRDTIPFGRMSTLAIVMPGYGQLYNKQYWKLPVLYGGVAAFTYAGVSFGKKAQTHKSNLNRAKEFGNQVATDYYFAKYRDAKTTSTMMYVGAVATYMYFMADAAFNYKGVEDSKNKATYLAFMFPGAGQLYNKQYWKLPIVYGGFATFAYIINFNGRGYTRYKRAYDDISSGRPDEFGGRYDAEILRNTKNNFRRARDMAIFYTAGFYLLTVIDAYVSASFKQYDVSDDLSLRVAPMINYDHMGSIGSGRGFGGSYGMSMTFRF